MARTVLVEWRGHSSLFSDPRVDYALLTDSLPPDSLKLLRVAAGRRNFRVDGKSAREVGPRLPDGRPAGSLASMSRTYRFGPGGRDRRGRPRPGYIQEMTEADARVLFASPSASEFRIVDPSGDTERANHASRPTGKPLILPETGLDFSMVRTKRVDQLRRLDDLLDANAGKQVEVTTVTSIGK